VICHGDVAPYNCAVVDGQVVGFIDFDTAHPAPRRWDVADAAYRFAPLHAPSNPDSAGDPATQARPAAGFCRSYGVPFDGELLDAVAERLTALIDVMRARADSGDAAFARHIADGHLGLCETDIAYLREQRDVMLAAVAKPPVEA
jgi:Ser/Thr protein kinase RdoA (MazF antagonist)